MRPIDGHALYERFEKEMVELIKSTRHEKVGLEAISLLCGAKLISDAPTLESVPFSRLCFLLGEKKFPPCLGECGECEPKKSAAECWRGYITKLMEETRV